jgi:iron complex transport system ATP-binding protein
MTASNALTVRNLNFAYDGGLRLKDISFNAAGGEFIALIGPNGCGKTTLLKLLLGLLSPTAGVIELFGQPLANLDSPARAKTIAYVAQQPAASFPLAVRELVTLGRYPHGAGWRQTTQDEQAITAALQKTGAAHLSERPFNALSGGEKQKVLIARALAQSARLLLLDEPTLHLDLNYQLQILSGLRKLCQDQGMTVITVIHDINLVGLFADKALCLKDGELRAFGAVADVVSPAGIKELLNVDMNMIEDTSNNRRYLIPKL